jgi:hypothetical protein
MNAIENDSIQNAIPPFTFINISRYKPKTFANGSDVEPRKKGENERHLKKCNKNAFSRAPRELKQAASPQQACKHTIPSDNVSSTSPVTLSSIAKLILTKQAIASCLVRLPRLTILRDIANLNLFLNFEGRYGGDDCSSCLHSGEAIGGGGGGERAVFELQCVFFCL